jgi:colanic acid/amylovoran biosynthesis glycosyltransferase
MIQEPQEQAQHEVAEYWELDRPEPKVAYIMSRFPKLTETFILFEMGAIELDQMQVELYPLLREKTNVMHPEAKAWVERAHYTPFFSVPILWAQLHYLFLRPKAYFGALATLIRSTWGSANFLIGGLGIFPKSAYFAWQMELSSVQHVHAHFANHPAAAAFIIHRLTGIPYSFTAHGSDLHMDRHMLREKVADAAFVAAISSYNRDLILEDAGQQYADKVEVIHCGVDTSVFQPIEPSEDDGILSLLCIGTLHEVKGQEYLIEACRLLRERGVAVRCRFVGDGPDHAMLEQRIAAAGLGDQVELLGRRTREQIAALLRETDVLVTPSVPTKSGKREGIPVVLMEGMASGVPVVASGISGIPELVDDQQSGLLTPPRDPQALADALERLAKKPAERRRFGLAGRAKVERDFDLRRNTRLLIERFLRSMD